MKKTIKDLIKGIEEGSIVYNDDEDSFKEVSDDHRLTVRIPRTLMEKMDTQRKLGFIKLSRNMFILKLIDEATKYKKEIQMEMPNYVENFSYSTDYIDIKKTPSGWVYIIKGVNPKADKDFIKDEIQAAFEAYAQANKAIHNWHEKGPQVLEQEDIDKKIEVLSS